MAQATGIDKTQLSKGHRKRSKQRTWKIEPISNLLHEMNERTQFSVIAIRDDTIGPDDFRDNSSVAMTQLCSLQVPTTISWSNGSCNEPATLFKTIWTRDESFDKLEVSDDHLEPDRKPDNLKLEFYDETRLVTLY